MGYRSFLFPAISVLSLLKAHLQAHTLLRKMDDSLPRYTLLRIFLPENTHPSIASIFSRRDETAGRGFFATLFLVFRKIIATFAHIHHHTNYSDENSRIKQSYQTGFYQSTDGRFPPPLTDNGTTDGSAI